MNAGCRPVIVVMAEVSISRARALTSQLDEVVVVAGGATRRESVARGLQEVESEQVVVHDAARPFAPPELVRNALGALGEADGVVPALPLDETVKRVNDGIVQETVDRSLLYRAQTPQAFLTKSLRTAHSAAQGPAPTDDAQLVEAAGGKVVTIPGSPRNLKITFTEDLAIAEAMLKR